MATKKATAKVKVKAPVKKAAVKEAPTKKAAPVKAAPKVTVSFSIVRRIETR